ncbi:uncharacterized protein LOC130697069 [Daphnia carinata]|uniref:uncharacterized protein LOC130697069 n=1 Tax=Daphnia carinata TaxID=120202 RepID=UPI002579AC9D|nr:uncharacterized protein LOC130697069 [Daphnia carinata]
MKGIQLFLTVVVIASCWAALNPTSRQQQEIEEHFLPLHLSKIDPLSARALMSNDFESGFIDPWYDASPSNVHWVVEDFAAPNEANNPAPTPSFGTKYLRATRNANLNSGLLILRTLKFTALPADQISISFWIRSKYTGQNTLDLVLDNGGTESTLYSWSSYSTSVNFEWRKSVPVPIPVDAATDVTLIFYAYCGGNPEDAIAIDDIVFESSNVPATTPVSDDCQDFLQGNTSVPCWNLEGKCYCFSTITTENWGETEKFCKDGGMNLLSIETQEENQLIYNHWLANPEAINKRTYWTSGRYCPETEWLWIWSYESDGRNCQQQSQFNYINWAENEPT